MVRSIRSGLLTLGCLLTLGAAARAQPEGQKAVGKGQVETFQDKVLEWANAERAKVKAPPLVVSDDLARAAQAHAAVCARAGSWKGDGKTASERLTDQRLTVPIYSAGRNTLRVDTWVKESLGKPEPLKLILDPKTTRLGCGVQESAEGRPFAVVLFGQARARVDTAQARARFADEVLALVNAERKQAGLQPLKLNPELTRAAQGHAENMARQERLEHDLDDRTPQERIRAAGYKGKRGAENLANGQLDARDVMKGWMASPGHRKNILDPAFREVGIGVAQNPKTFDLYFCQCFGARE